MCHVRLSCPVPSGVSCAVLLLGDGDVCRVVNFWTDAGGKCEVELLPAGVLRSSSRRAFKGWNKLPSLHSFGHFSFILSDNIFSIWMWIVECGGAVAVTKNERQMRTNELTQKSKQRELSRNSSTNELLLHYSPNYLLDFLIQ